MYSCATDENGKICRTFSAPICFQLFFCYAWCSNLFPYTLCIQVLLSYLVTYAIIAHESKHERSECDARMTCNNEHPERKREVTLDCKDYTLFYPKTPKRSNYERTLHISSSFSSLLPARGNGCVFPFLPYPLSGPRVAEALLSSYQ